MKSIEDYSLFFYLFIILMVLLDAGMTAYALQNGHYEINPFTNKYGINAHLMIQFAGWTAMLAVTRVNKPVSQVASYTMLAACGLFAVNNIISAVMLI